MPRFTVTIDIEVQFTSGKFASNDAIAEQIENAIDIDNLDAITVDEGEYEVVDATMTVEHVKPVRTRKTRLTSKGDGARAAQFDEQHAARPVVLEPEVKIDGEWVPNPLLADEEVQS